MSRRSHRCYYLCYIQKEIFYAIKTERRGRCSVLAFVELSNHIEVSNVSVDLKYVGC